MIERQRSLVFLGGILVIFLGISLTAITLAFQPAVIETEEVPVFAPPVAELRETVTGGYAPAALTQLGLQLRAKAWLRYPQYNGGLAAIALCGFLGMIATAQAMYECEQWRGFLEK